MLGIAVIVVVVRLAAYGDGAFSWLTRQQHVAMGLPKPSAILIRVGKPPEHRWLHDAAIDLSGFEGRSLPFQ